MVKTYDIKCYELARAFLADYQVRATQQQDTEALACEIQQAIEDWLQENREKE